MPFKGKYVFPKMTGAPVGETWRNGEIVAEGLQLKVTYLSNVDEDFSGEIGRGILDEFRFKVGRDARGVFGVRCSRVKGVLMIGSTNKIQ